MTDPFQIECHQLRTRIGRLRRRTDRHLNKLFKPPRLIESMNSFMGSMPLKWAAAAQVLDYLLAIRARRKATNEHGRGTFEQAARLLREIAVWLRRFYRVLRSLRSNHRSTSATTTKETTDVRSPDA